MHVVYDILHVGDSYRAACLSQFKIYSVYSPLSLKWEESSDSDHITWIAQWVQLF